MPKADK